MFWSEPYCPCDPVTKIWIEKRLAWLSHQFPSNIFTDRATIGIFKSNREKEEDLVGTGILPVILNRQAGSLSYHPVLPSDPIRYGYKTFENPYNYLGSKVINDFKDAGRYLFKTGDSSCKPGQNNYIFEKLDKIFSPFSWLFSGWNCSATIFSLATAQVNFIP
jgi:hypothetical protein